MSVTSKFRCYGEVIGSSGSDDNKVSGVAVISDTPTKYGGPYNQVFTTTAAIDIIGVVSGELIGLYIEAISSGLYVNPCLNDGLVTCCNFIPQGQWNFYTFKTAVSAVPYAQAQTTRAEARILFVAVT